MPTWCLWSQLLAWQSEAPTAGSFLRAMLPWWGALRFLWGKAGLQAFDVTQVVFVMVPVHCRSCRVQSCWSVVKTQHQVVKMLFRGWKRGFSEEKRTDVDVHGPCMSGAQESKLFVPHPGVHPICSCRSARFCESKAAGTSRVTCAVLSVVHHTDRRNRVKIRFKATKITKGPFIFFRCSDLTWLFLREKINVNRWREEAQKSSAASTVRSNNLWILVYWCLWLGWNRRIPRNYRNTVPQRSGRNICCGNLWCVLS